MSDPPMVPVAVVDSSVLVPRWARHVLAAVAARAEPRYVPAWSEWIIAETWRILAWEWLNRAADPDIFEWDTLSRAANSMLRRLLPVMRLVSLHDYDGPVPWSGLTDPDDVPIWQTAVLAGAQYVVSQNINDFPPPIGGRHVYGGVEYVTAIEFIEDVLGMDAAAVYGAPLPQGARIRAPAR